MDTKDVGGGAGNGLRRIEAQKTTRAARAGAGSEPPAVRDVAPRCARGMRRGDPLLTDGDVVAHLEDKDRAADEREDGQGEDGPIPHGGVAGETGESDGGAARQRREDGGEVAGDLPDTHVFAGALA